MGKGFPRNEQINDAPSQERAFYFIFLIDSFPLNIPRTFYYNSHINNKERYYNERIA